MTEPVARLAKFDVGALTAEQRSLYDSIVSSRSGGSQAFSLVDEDGGLEGPFNAMLLCPQLGQALQALGAAVRFGGALTDRAREIAILVVASEWDSGFERCAHEAVGRMIGLSDAELQAICGARFDAFTDPYEREVAEVAQALVRQGDLSDDVFAMACRRLGSEGVFELTTLVGYYATLALQLRVFRVPTPA